MPRRHAPMRRAALGAALASALAAANGELRAALRSAHPSPPPAVTPLQRTCGVLDPPASRVRNEQAFLRILAAQAPAAFAVTLPVKFHVLHSGSSGSVSAAAISAQIAALNVAYSGEALREDGSPGGGADTGVRFTLHDVLRHDVSSNISTSAGGTLSTPTPLQPAWFAACSPDNAVAISSELSIDIASYLNVFTCLPAGGLLGWISAFPQASAEADPGHAAFILHSTVPGGASAPYDLGATLVHEVGHLLGLYHTFQGGCGSATDDWAGDAVDDTPPEASPAFGTAAQLAGRDTCTALGQSDPTLGPWFGLDPTSSYMDYSNDSAMTVFSPGQAARLQLIIAQFKPTLCANMPGGSCDASIGSVSPPPPPLPPQPPPPAATPSPPRVFFS